jgi:AraC family transcriptional regulator
MPDQRTDYEARFHKVCEHIDRHLDEALDLNALAQVAHFSPYHFHRLFAAWMGETLGDYLRRRRVETAAMRLIAQPRLSVLQAALAVGFGSGEAFTRAFKLRFGAAPSAWRAQQRASYLFKHGKHSNPDQLLGNFNQALACSVSDDKQALNTTQETRMTVTLIKREAQTIAYLRHTGPYGAAVGAFWGEVVYPWMVTNNLLGCPRYGIGHDDPSITDPAQCRYDAGVEVPEGASLSGNAMRTTIPGGRYASMHFKGTSEQIGDAWRQLLRDWLATSGMQLDARPSFEYYPPGSQYDPITGVFDCQICIPVVAL